MPGMLATSTTGRRLGSQTTTSSLTERTDQILVETRREILRDAVHCGWLRTFTMTGAPTKAAACCAHPDFFLTATFFTSQGEDAVAGRLLPNAMHFGLVHGDDLPLVRFARHWVRTFSVLPGWHQELPQAPRCRDRDLPKAARRRLP